MKRVEILYKRKVVNDIINGADCEDVVKKYPGVSMYYARKWAKEIDHKEDLSHFVRDRYKWDVLVTCEDIENKIAGLVPDDGGVPEEAWDQCLEYIRKRLYLLIEDVIKKK